MAVVHKNLTEQEIHNIMADVSNIKVYAECSVCKLFIVEENSGDGDVYTVMEQECSCE
tara:strand:+ start:854 stop:1027 length:174 start_codon:yes stop_codon:yes gene_type:complete